MSKSDRLSCGGKGPCCHVGYAHRHCEHCDTVIATVAYVPMRPYPYGPQWSGTQISQSANDLRIQSMNAASSTQTMTALPEHACEEGTHS